MEKFILRYRNDIFFGINIIEESLSNIIKFLKPEKALIITGRRSAKVSGALDKVVKILEDLNVSYEVFNEVTANPTVSIAERALDFCKNVKPSLIICIGGGSVIDVSKVVAAAYYSGKSVSELFRGEVSSGKIPLVVINLTHGSGSEADRYAVLTDERSMIKKGIADENFYPTISIDDPELTKTLPRDQTVYTSIDAFYHCLESSTSIATSPFTRVLASQGMKLILQYLPRAYFNGDDIEARYWLMYSALIGGICIDNSRTHIVHAVEHAVSGIKPEIAHGLGLAVLGPKLISYLYMKCPEKFTILKEFIPDLKLRSEEYRRVEYFLKSISEQYGIKTSLSYLGFGKDDIKTIVKITEEASKHLIDLTPCKITYEEIEKILHEMV